MRGYFTNRFQRLVWLLLCLPGLLPAAEQGLLYELSRPGEAPSYLFGTMHVDDPEVLKVMARIRDSFDHSDRLVLEMELDDAAMAAAARGMMLPPGASLAELLGEGRFRRLLPLAADYGLAAEVLQRMKPWAVAVTLSLPPSSGGPVLDQLLYQQALQRKMGLQGLETAAEQLAVLDRMPQQLQIEMLVDTLNNYQQMPQYWQALRQAYLARDLSRLESLGRQQMTGMSQGVSDWFEQQLIQARNVRMIERLRPLLEGGGVFVAVGALHLPGEGGLLQGLRQQGFSVRAIW